MTNRADAVALRSLLVLSGALAFVIALRFHASDLEQWLTTMREGAVQAAVAQSASEESKAFEERPLVAAPEVVPPIDTDEKIRAAVTPLAIVPARISRLRVESSQWSAPLHVPTGQTVGIKFSLGRIRVERDGQDAGVVFRNPTFVPNRSGMTLKPLAALDRTPRVFWFEKGIRVLRFISLEEKQSEEVQILWSK